MNSLPKLRDSSYLLDWPIGRHTFMKVGGNADVYFAPNSMHDLIAFLNQYDYIDDVFCCGNWSNVIVKDLGIRCVLSLEQLCNEIVFADDEVTVGAGVLMMHFIQECIKRSVSCCEKLYTIPGRIGGMVYMNAGIPEFEIKNVLSSVVCIDKYTGSIFSIDSNGLDMQYRSSGIGKNLIILFCKLKAKYMDRQAMIDDIRLTRSKRLKTQPITSCTCGSTFKNPVGHSAWRLIRDSGAHTMSVGGARMSELHSNFLINDGTASASEVIELIDLVRERVLHETGIELIPEVKIVGR